MLGGIWLRCITRWRAHDLDNQLALGADPMESDELSLRVAQLGSERACRRLACSLRGAVELAYRPFDPLRIGPPLIRRSEVHDNRELLLELAARLAAGGPLGVEGLAITSLLVGDRSSPLFRKAGGGSLSESANSALLMLERGHRTNGSVGAT